MGFIKLEDLSGQAEVLCFSKSLANVEELLQSERPLLLGLQISADQRDGDKVRLVLEDAQLLEEVSKALTAHLMVKVSEQTCEKNRIERVLRALRAKPGKTPVMFRLHIPGKGVAYVEANKTTTVDASEELIGDIEQILGRGTVSLG